MPSALRPACSRSARHAEPERADRRRGRASSDRIDAGEIRRRHRPRSPCSGRCQNCRHSVSSVHAGRRTDRRSCRIAAGNDQRACRAISISPRCARQIGCRLARWTRMFCTIGDGILCLLAHGSGSVSSRRVPARPHFGISFIASSATLLPRFRYRARCPSCRIEAGWVTIPQRLALASGGGFGSCLEPRRRAGWRGRDEKGNYCKIKRTAFARHSGVSICLHIVF